MCSLAFCAFLRVGEMVVTNNNSSHLFIDNVAKLVNAANHVVSIKVTFRNYKHSYNQAPCSLFIQRQPSFCPVQILLDYLKVRGHSLGPRFTIRGLPVTSNIFAACLPLLVSVVASTQRATKVIVSESVLLRMLLSEECLMRRSEF